MTRRRPKTTFVKGSASCRRPFPKGKIQVRVAHCFFAVRIRRHIATEFRRGNFNMVRTCGYRISTKCARSGVSQLEGAAQMAQEVNVPVRAQVFKQCGVPTIFTIFCTRHISYLRISNCPARVSVRVATSFVTKRCSSENS